MRKKENRIGKINVTIEFIENRKLNKYLFKHFTPHYVENDQFLGRLTYIGYCKYFDIKEEGCVVPEYEMLIHSFERGTDAIEFKKLN